MSIKTDLIGEQIVKGNIKESLQIYKIYYYPPEMNYPEDKVWLYFNRKHNDKLLGTKSLCFASPEQHRSFILNNILYYLYWLEKKSIDYIPNSVPIEEYRRRLMDALFNDLRTKLIGILKERRKQ